MAEFDREIDQRFVAQKNPLHSWFRKGNVRQRKGCGFGQIHLQIAKKRRRVDVFIPLIFLIIPEEHDSFLITEDGPRIATPVEIWPLKRVRIQGADFLRPDILER